MIRSGDESRLDAPYGAADFRHSFAKEWRRMRATDKTCGHDTGASCSVCAPGFRQSLAPSPEMTSAPGPEVRPSEYIDIVDSDALIARLQELDVMLNHDAIQDDDCEVRAAIETLSAQRSRITKLEEVLRTKVAQFLCLVHGRAACPEEYMLSLDGEPLAGYRSIWSEAYRCGQRYSLAALDAASP